VENHRKGQILSMPPMRSYEGKQMKEIPSRLLQNLETAISVLLTEITQLNLTGAAWNTVELTLKLYERLFKLYKAIIK